jgi:hypothetical protein
MATHSAIEAPFQILMKLTLMSLGILKPPGANTTFVVVNTYGAAIDLSLLPILTIFFSIFGIFSAASRTFEPIVEETNW